MRQNAPSEVVIERIDAYDDPRFSGAVLRQHGAFLVDGAPCEVEIVGADTAVVRGRTGPLVGQLIERFRFYAQHICRFYGANGELLREFAPVRLFPMPLADIQPSQFYVDADKLCAVRTFLRGPQDIAIPVQRFGARVVSQDGHTRLAAAAEAGYDTVRAFFAEPCDAVLRFAAEARRRGILSPYDLKLVSHREYEVVWNRFCDEFSAEVNTEEDP